MLRWQNDTIDNFYCFDIPGRVLILHPTSKATWIFTSSVNNKVDISVECHSFKEAKDRAEEFYSKLK